MCEPLARQDGTGTLDVTLGSSNPATPASRDFGPVTARPQGDPRRACFLAWDSPVCPGTVEEMTSLAGLSSWKEASQLGGWDPGETRLSSEVAFLCPRMETPPKKLKLVGSDAEAAQPWTPRLADPFLSRASSPFLPAWLLAHPLCGPAFPAEP